MRPQDGLPSEKDLPEGWRISEFEVGFSRVKLYPEREDGAYVYKSDDDFHAKPWLDGYRPWMAYPTEDAPPLGYRRTRRKGRARGMESALVVPRRFKTAMAAIRALEREAQ